MDRFGVGTGRLLTKFPVAWGEMVLQACAEKSTIARHRHIEGLNILKTRMCKTKRPYDEAKPWFQNAEKAHRAEPFRAIIVQSVEPDGDHVLKAEEIGDDTPLWQVPSDGKVLRSADKLAELLAPLLYQASEVLFVDPHFCGAAKYGKPLTKFLAKARDGKTPHTVEYHLSAKSTGECFLQELKKLRPFLGLLDGEKIDFIRWACLPEGENLHPRYVLTNRGGVSIDYGLDEGDGTTNWTRLGESLWRDRKKQFARDTAAFEFKDGLRLTTSGISKLPQQLTGRLASK